MVRLSVSLECQTTSGFTASFNQSDSMWVTNSIIMTNAEKLMQEGLVAVSVNLDGAPIVCLKSDPYQGKFIVKQRFNLSLGEPTTLTTLHDPESGVRIFTARDESDHGLAEAAFSRLQYDCMRKAEENAKVRTASVVAMLGFLGC